MTEQRRTTSEEARRVGDAIGVDWARFDLEQFRAGMDVEFEHGAHDPQTDVTHDDPILTGKIALAHMKEFPDYYVRLERMEAEAEREQTAHGAAGSEGIRVDYLQRDLAPVTAEQWRAIDQAVAGTARGALVGRRIVSVVGPLGGGVEVLPNDLVGGAG